MPNYSGGVSGAAEASPSLFARPRRLPRRRPRRRGRRSSSGPIVSSGPESVASMSSSSSLAGPFRADCDPARTGAPVPSRPVPKSSSTTCRDRSGFAGPRDRSRGGRLPAVSDFACSLLGCSLFGLSEACTRSVACARSVAGLSACGLSIGPRSVCPRCADCRSFLGPLFR